MNQVRKKLGELLKLERERRRMSLEDLSVELRKFFLYVKKSGTPELSVKNPKVMIDTIARAIEQANKQSIENIFDDFLG